jgi:hypothetical protein
MVGLQIRLPDKRADNLPELQLDFGQVRLPSSVNYRYRSALWAVNDISLSAFGMILTVLIALITAGLAKHRIQAGFKDTFMLLTPSTVHMTVATLHSFEASFLLRFIPVVLMNLSSCIWDMADMFYRITEPFASMSEPGPAAANLLLDYPSTAPVAITIKAIQNGHWRVALCSTFSLLANIPPIIATSIFVGTPTPDGVAISIEPINFWVFYVLLIVYLVFLVVWHIFFFFVPRSVSKLAASTQALITLGSPSPYPAHLSSLSNLSSP